MKKKILGLDLGVTSIGWALIEENDSKVQIIGMGSRIIPLDNDDKDEFTKGNAISKNKKRTEKRTQRKGYDRYQQRRANLISILTESSMIPDESLRNIPAASLWGMRARAANSKIELKELGRVLLHINQKRGYKSSRSDANLTKKDTDYVATIKNRQQELNEKGLTIGQYLFNQLTNDSTFRIKQLVYPREEYINEFDRIINEQQKHYPTIISDNLKNKIRNEIIFYQRKLKSQKGLVSVCEFEGFTINDIENPSKSRFVGPKVAHRSSPLFQVVKIWESINNITIKNKNRKEFELSLQNKYDLFEYLNNNEKITEKKLFDILNISHSDGWYGNKMTSKGIQGNTTISQLVKYLDMNSPLLQFQLKIIEDTSTEVFVVDKKTGEILASNTKKYVGASIENEPLYKLWHTIYSINDSTDCIDALTKNFNLDLKTATELASIDFAKLGFGNKSIKAIRKILPFLMDGYYYSEACSFAGYNHSNSNTKDENLRKELLNVIPNLDKGSLRQPIVEKILNQLINVVNEIINDNRGWVSYRERINNQFEIRIELARELKQSKDERNSTFQYLSKREKESKDIILAIENLKLKATRSRIHKYRMFFENTENITSINSTCIYCGKGFGLTDALSGNNIDVEHIIPKSKLFDDSQSNKTLSHRSCNAAKGDLTAYDYMKNKGEDELNQYIESVNKILSKTKRDKLLASHEEYLIHKKSGKVSDKEKQLWEGFIDRQLRETQYIAKKAIAILNNVAINVFASSGSVTSYLRDKWGWDDVTMNLQLPKYKALGMTTWKEWETHEGQKHKQEVINNWSKRDDHRHHAIDALVIACTKQGFIQRLNTLNSQANRDEMYAAVGKKNSSERLSLLDKYIISQKPFTTKEVEEKVSSILISFKAGKKVATIAKRKIKKGKKTVVVQSGIIVPRGALSEESVYGKIKEIDKNRSSKYLFENPSLIINPFIKEKVEIRLLDNNNNSKSALASLKKSPIYIDSDESIPLEFAHCFKEEIVIKYPIEGLKINDLEYVVDAKVRFILEQRIIEDKGKIKNSLENPIWFNKDKGIKMRSVRMRTGLNAVQPIKSIDKANNIEFDKYVKPGNNHHVAIYKDEDGNFQEVVCTFWDAVERKKHGLPIIIKSPIETYNLLSDTIPQSVISKLPPINWVYVESLQQNEMLLLGDESYNFENLTEISDKLYIVWSISNSDYWFRHHLETKNSELKNVDNAKECNRFYRSKSLNAFFKLNPRKIRINNLGEIIS